MTNEKLIEEALHAYHGVEDRGQGWSWSEESVESMRAALAVFEKALGEATVTPTDDEREAWRDEAIRRYPHAEAAKYMRQALQNAFIEGAKFAAGFRRSEVPEPSAEPPLRSAWHATPAVTSRGAAEQGEPSDALDLERLEKLANAATPGPWEYIFGGPTQYEDGEWYEPTESGVRSRDWENDFPHADAEFIAAADPQTVLALIAALRAAGGVR